MNSSDLIKSRQILSDLIAQIAPCLLRSDKGTNGGEIDVHPAPETSTIVTNGGGHSTSTNGTSGAGSTKTVEWGRRRRLIGIMQVGQQPQPMLGSLAEEATAAPCGTVLNALAALSCHMEDHVTWLIMSHG